MKILTADEMRAVDRVTAERFGVDSLDLMQSAGAAVARFVLREYSDRRHIAVLCGKGNNGGDAVAARELANSGCDVRVLLLGRPADLKGDAKAAFGAMGLVRSWPRTTQRSPHPRCSRCSHQPTSSSMPSSAPDLRLHCAASPRPSATG